MATDDRLNLRISAQFRQQIEDLAAYHGLKPTSYAHSLLVKAVRHEYNELRDQLPEPVSNIVARRKMGIPAAEVTLTPEKKHRPIPNVEYDLNAKFVRDDSGREAVEKNKRKRTG